MKLALLSSSEAFDHIKRGFLYDCLGRDSVATAAEELFSMELLTYDKNGNMTSDGGRGLVISYNILNLQEQLKEGETVVVEYSYLSDGTKCSVASGGNGYHYLGSFIYQQSGVTTSFESVSFGGGRVVYSNRWKFNGKELQTTGNTAFLDYGARMYDPTIARWGAVDPMAEKYFALTPYLFSGNNPIRYIDPDGRDVWEINNFGEIINRIKDKTQDAFFMVDNKGNRTYTTDADGNKNYNSISFEYGTIAAVKVPWVDTKNKDGSITKTKLTHFRVIGDSKATQLFEFMANPGTTTNVEWTHAKIGAERSNQNIVGTSHNPTSTAVGHYLKIKEYTLREVNHNHPSGIARPSGVLTPEGKLTGDLAGAESYHKSNKNTILNIYIHPGKYFRYNQYGLINSK